MSYEALDQTVPVEEIHPSPLNRKLSDNDPRIDSLALSMKETQLHQPIVIRTRPRSEGGFEIVCGERRWRAARKLGWETIAAIVREYSDDDAHAARLIENMQRQDVPPLEQAEGVKVMLERFGGDVGEVGAQLGVSESWVRVRANLSNLSAEWRKELADPDTAYTRLADHVTWQEQLAKLPQETQDLLARTGVLKHVANLERFKQEIGEQMRKISDAPWLKKMETRLSRKFGACKNCLKRSDRNADLFADLLPADDAESRCLDAVCWNKKIVEWLKLEYAALKKEHADAVVLAEYYSRNIADQIAAESEIVSSWDCAEPEDPAGCELEENERLVWALLVGDERRGERTQLVVTDEVEDAPETDEERAERQRRATEATAERERRERRSQAFCDRVQTMTPEDLKRNIQEPRGDAADDYRETSMEVIRLAAMVYNHDLSADAALKMPWEILGRELWDNVRDQILEIASEEMYDQSGRLEELAKVIGIDLPE